MTTEAKKPNEKWRVVLRKDLVLEVDEKCWEMRIKTRRQLVERIFLLALKLLERDSDNESSEFERLEMAYGSQDGASKNNGEKNNGAI